MRMRRERNSRIMKEQLKKGTTVESKDTAEIMDDANVKGMTPAELMQYLSASNKKIGKMHKELEGLMDKKNRQPDRYELILDCLAAEKNIIDEYSDNLVAATDVGHTQVAKEIKNRMLPELRRYNRLVDEFKRATDQSLTMAPYSIPDDIMAGRDYAVLPKITYDIEAPADEGTLIATMSSKDAQRVIAEGDRAMAPVKRALSEQMAVIKESEGDEKSIAIIEAMGLQKQLIDSDTELLLTLCHAGVVKETVGVKKRLTQYAAAYNGLADSYEKHSGSEGLTRAPATLADDIAGGKPYVVLPELTYTVVDPTNGNKTTDYENVKNNIRAQAENEAAVANAALAAMIAEQANKDLLVYTKRAEQRSAALESEVDLLAYRFGRDTTDVKKRKKEIAREVEAIRQETKTILKFEEADNKRYYAVVENDPDTMKLPRRADKAKIARLRQEIIDKLNERDAINGKLLAIYNGTTMNNGVVENENVRRIKDEAAAKLYKKDRKIAKKIEKLPATRAEKDKMYEVMNDKLDAASTIAAAKHRLATEKLSRQDKKALKQDIANCEAIMKQCDGNVDWMAAKVTKRAINGKSDGGSGWLIGLVVILILLVGGAGAFLFMNPDILASISEMLGL